MPNHDTLYAIIHIAWDRMIIVDTAPSTVDAMKRLFQEGNYYSEEYINKKTCWKKASANGFPRIEIISPSIPSGDTQCLEAILSKSWVTELAQCRSRDELGIQWRKQRNR